MSELTVGQLKGLTVNNNTITVPSGHKLYAPGHVIQVVTLDNTGRASQGFSANTAMDVYGMSLSITPKSASSKILVQARWFGEMTAADRVYNSVFGLTRNGTQIGRQTDPGSTVINGITMAALSYEGTDASSTPETASFFITDSPATTSSVTYSVTFISDAGGTLYTNRAVGWSGQSSGFELGTSAMVLMEIAQ